MRRLEDLERTLAGLRSRIDDLRSARLRYPEESDALLDAAMAELATAEELLQSYLSSLRPGSTPRPGGATRSEREHKMFRHAFRSLPVPVALIDADGTVRRVNAAAARLLDVPQGYLTGKSLPMFVEPARRAAIRSQVSRVASTGEQASVKTRLSHGDAAQDARLTFSQIRIPGEPDRMVAAMILPVDTPATDAQPAGPERPAAALAAAARRLDLMAEFTRILLDTESLTSPVSLHRAVRLLADRWADWVIIDLTGDGEPRRAAVAGPSQQPTRILERLDPAKAPIVSDVIESGGSVIHELAGSERLLGMDPEGRPVLPALEAGSLISVPLRSDDGPRGVLTLVRRLEEPPFSLADLGFAESLGEELALAIQARASYQQRDQVAESLEISLQPRRLPQAERLEAAVVHRGRPEPEQAGGDFYDGFRVGDVYAVSLGQAFGAGDGAAASAIVRNGIRLLSVWDAVSARILQRCGQGLAAHAAGMRVAAVAAYFRMRPKGADVTITCAGHPPPALLRADGRLQFASGGGEALGSADGGQVATEKVKLAKGDALVFYSGGLVRSANGDGEPYGDHRVADALVRCTGENADALASAVAEDQAGFIEEPASGDVVVLAVRMV